MTHSRSSQFNNAELYENSYKENFSFGENWKLFLETLDESKVAKAQEHLQNFIKNDITGKTVIDFGSGSGLMSLCFVLLGAKKVLSVDIDDNSIECAKILRKKYEISEDIWEIQKGSILDEEFVSSLGKFDIVYSWGVIHHTGNMWKGLANISKLVDVGGLLYIAIYNKSNILIEGTSGFWEKIKRIYAKNRLIRPLFKLIYTSYYILGLLTNGINPIRYIREYKSESMRGMDFFRDIEDWLGGHPYEYASVEELEKFYTDLGYAMTNTFRARSIGCNELLFVKK
ncbi:MAG: class I SAM-dependent methyltransferase [Candidatus Gracilibacteria bacterium]|nr:class I SAM-dependent methyltransferase [Candidatus Gracilibacteria bacterium]